ncbi:MAG TPA: IS110 family transposase [Longimicrobiales bacterium]
MYVAGIDAHTTYLVVVVVSNTGERVLGPTRVPYGKREQLMELLAAYRPLEVVVETSPGWAWLRDTLVAQGIGFVLAHAKRLRAIAEANYKRDAIDAELLARMRVAGCIPAVHAKPPAQRELALLVRHRAWLVRQRTCLANRVHAQLHTVGLRLARGRLLTKSGQQWVRQQAWPQLGPEQRRLIRTHLRLIAQTRHLIRGLDQQVEKVAATLPACALLRTIPGIGAYRALALASEVLPVERFAAAKYLVSYAGLAPRSSASGLRPIRYGALPAGANRWLRGTLVRTVVTHLQYAPDSPLSAYYAGVKQRLGWRVARIATARKLTRIVHHMLKTGESWSTSAGGASLAPPAPPRAEAAD